MISDFFVPRAGDALCIRSEHGSTKHVYSLVYAPDLFITRLYSS